MGGEDRQLILIERATFGDWLEPSARVSRSPKSLSNRAVTEILEVLTAHASETGMKYKRDWLLEQMQAVLGEQGFTFSKLQFEKRI